MIPSGGGGCAYACLRVRTDERCLSRRMCSRGTASDADNKVCTHGLVDASVTESETARRGAAARTPRERRGCCVAVWPANGRACAVPRAIPRSMLLEVVCVRGGQVCFPRDLLGRREF